MANSLLTPVMVTREALRILHQKLNFIGNINREYDDSYAKTGAKIGDTLKIRLPNRYTVRTGATLSAQDTTETFTQLQVATQKGVDLNFTSADLTMSLDDFSARVLDPAMAVLAANIEADALSMINGVYSYVKNIGAALTFAKVLGGRKVLNDALAPMDANRFCILNTQDNVDLVDALKGLFQDSSAIKSQYKEGMMGRTAGFDFYENTLIPTAQTGTSASVTGYLTNGGSQTGSVIVVDTGANTFAVGDIIVISGVLACHPESKASLGNLQPFVVQTAVSSATSLSVDPAIFMSGAYQNVVNPAPDNAAIYKVGEASVVYKPSLVFHRDAFTFATADLMLPKGVDFAAREVQDGISMRVVRQYDINNDKLPTRVDVLYGYKAIRPQLAARILSN